MDESQLSSTLINFELVQILMRVNERFGSFDRSLELHESRRELQKQAKHVITHKKKGEKRKYYYVSSTSDSWSNDSDCQQFDKRQKTKKKNRGSNAEQKQGNRKKIRLSSTLSARLTEQ